MSEHISRNTYRSSNGFLGVFIEEGAPIVDADWNEAQDIQWNLIRTVARDAQLVGSRGETFKVIDPSSGDGQIVVLRGGRRPFYVDGIPIVWPRNRPLTLDVSDGHYHLSLMVRVETLGVADRPILRDPAIRSSARSSFRRSPRLSLELRRVTHAREAQRSRPAPLPQSEIELTVIGSYHGPNAYYRIELLGVNAGGRLADVLWDPENSAYRSEVTNLDLYSDIPFIEVSDPRGLEQGHFIRLEGPGFFERMTQWPDVVTQGLHGRPFCPVFQIQGVFGTLIYLRKTDPNRPTALQQTAFEHDDTIVVDPAPCWVEGRQVFIGTSELLTSSTQAQPADSFTVELRKPLELLDPNNLKARKFKVAEVTGRRAKFWRRWTLTKVEKTQLTLERPKSSSTPDDSPIPAGATLWLCGELESRRIKQCEDQDTNGVILHLDTPLAIKHSPGEGQVHLAPSGSEKRRQVKQPWILAMDPMYKIPQQLPPPDTARYPLTGAAESGDQRVLVDDAGVWWTGRSVSVGVCDTLAISERAQLITKDEQLWMVKLAVKRAADLTPDDSSYAVTFVDSSGRELASGELVSLKGDELQFRSEVNIGELTSVSDSVRIQGEIERRAIVEVESVKPGHGGQKPQVKLLLDSPLQRAHPAGSHGVSPMNTVFARRFAGAEWDVSVQSEEAVESSSDGGTVFDGGLSMLLSRTSPRPFWVPGEGWQLAARTNMYRDPLASAPVSDEPRYRAPLAAITVKDGQISRVTDIRARPLDSAIAEKEFSVSLTELTETHSDITALLEDQSDVVGPLASTGASWPVRRLVGALRDARDRDDFYDGLSFIDAIHSEIDVQSEDEGDS